MCGFLLPAHQQATEPIEPGVADLHDPAAWGMALWVSRSGEWVGLTGFFRNVRCQAVFCRCRTTLQRIVSAIQTQMAFFVMVHRHGDDHRVQNLSQHLAVMAVGSTQHHGQRNTFAIGQERSLGS